MKYCKDCWSYDRCNAIGETVDFAVDDGVCRDFDECKPMTNADRIRAMSDEELAVFLANPCECSVSPTEDGYRECGNELCKQHLLEWLKRPAED